MITKWLHISELGGDPWILPIWTAVNEAVKSGKATDLQPEVYRLGLHVSLRLNILPRVVKRVNSNTLLLYRIIREHGPEYVSTEAIRGYAFPVDDDLKYSLLADIDALLFELNSVCELMKNLFGLLQAHIGRPIHKDKIGKALNDVLSQSTRNANWFAMLDEHRNFFMHNGAPYIAVDLSNEPVGLEILIMKENIKSFTDPAKFVSLSQINSIVQGFIDSKQKLQDYLISLFKQE